MNFETISLKAKINFVGNSSASVFTICEDDYSLYNETQYNRSISVWYNAINTQAARFINIGEYYINLNNVTTIKFFVETSKGIIE